MKCSMLHKLIRAGLIAAVVFFLAAPALADASVALGAAGAVERAAQTQEALRNGSAASFGSNVSDDRRLFKLRWRLPWVLSLGNGLAPMPFAPGFTAAGLDLPGGVSLAAEPTSGMSAMVPTIGVGEAHKLGQVQLGVLSVTLGHGTIMDRYTNSPDGTSRSPGLLLEGNLAGLGAQTLLSNLAQLNSVAAARIYGRPVMWFLAPDATFQPNELDVDPRTELTGVWVAGLSAVIDPSPPTVSRGARLWAVSVDNEAALLDNQLVKTIAYVDVNALGVDDTVGSGVHPGALLMVDAAGFRLDASGELFYGSDGYVPRYFDRLYAIERVRAFGADKPKLDVGRPASWGYQLRVSAGVFETVTAFVEARDQFPLDPSRGASSGQLTVGASAFFVVAGGSVTASQTGISDVNEAALFGPGFIVTGEGRVALAPINLVSLVVRAWRAHVPAGDSPDDFLVVNGASAGIELNFDAF